MSNESRKDTQPGHVSRVALALSGGGSRAIAYHLGCLRALHDTGVLKKVKVISAVSGGSVIGALYAYHNRPFDAFDKQVQTLLQEGLLWKIVWYTVQPANLLRSIGTSLTAGAAAKVVQGARFIAKTIQAGVNWISPGSSSRATRPGWLDLFQPPLARWHSRSHAFEQVLRSHLFGDLTLSAERRNNIDVILNATELKTATAFRYGSRATSAWRYGHVRGNECTVAEAVAASAAYPLFLPAFHRRYTFVNENGSIEEKEVILTDGGVYDNLGTTCLQPGRNPNYTDHTYDCDAIIACHAGMGQWPEKGRPYGWMSRISRSMLTTFRKNEDSQKGQVLQHAQCADAPLKASILSSLGQKDENLRRDPCIQVPSDLVPREAVVHYPTDFNPMPNQDLTLITSRGEQVTRSLIEAYWPQ